MPPDRVDLGHALQLPPAGAIAHLRTKGYAVSWRWWDVWQEAHQRAFTVAKMARRDLLEQTRAIIDRALATGMTEKQAAGILEERLRAAGWWGRKVIVDPDGRAERVQLGSPHRIRTILRTNLLSAYAAGRYARQRETRQARPYWMYVAVLDPSTRDRHRALHGTILPADSPAWDAIYPPNGFNCRCRVRALTEAEVRATGRRVVDRVEVTDVEHQVGVDRETGEVITRPGKRIGWTAAGEKRTFSPDPGWSGRPGSSLVRPGGGGEPGPDEPTWRTFGRPAAADLPAAPPFADPGDALVDPPRVAHRSRVRTLTGTAASGRPFVRTPIERVSVTRAHAASSPHLVPALADPDEVWLTHYPATKARRAEYRVRYLRTTADGGALVTVRPDGSLTVASVARGRLDAQRRGVLLHARGAPQAAPFDEPTRALEREMERSRAEFTRLAADVNAAAPGTAAHQAAKAAADAAHQRYQQAAARYWGAWDELRAAPAAIDAASPQAAAVLREARAVLDDGSTFYRDRTRRLRMVIERPTDPELARRVDIQPEHVVAVEQWSQYVAPSLARQQVGVRLTATLRERASAVRLGVDRAELDVHAHSERETVVHELGHTVEDSSDALLTEAAAYLRRVSRGVGSLGADGDYVKGVGRWQENTWDGRLDRYTGRLYTRPAVRAVDVEGRRVNSTEVISVGLQRLAKDPVWFARRDWDFFSFLVRRVLWRD